MKELRVLGRGRGRGVGGRGQAAEVGSLMSE
jgi:hypothetical protein